MKNIHASNILEEIPGEISGEIPMEKTQIKLSLPI